MNEIRFYKVNEAFGFFSNFSPHRIWIDGEVWKTVEHYFQANKFEDMSVRDKIKQLESPMQAAKEGRNRNNILRTDWELVKEDIMLKALIAKFFQHLDLRVELLSTADALIIEDTVKDSYWANGGDDTGKNRLGELLMDVRNNLKNISTDINIVLPPWIAFPNITQFDMFWRMGIGENYIMKWSEYYFSNNDKEQYQKLFPENTDWIGFYEV